MASEPMTLNDLEKKLRDVRELGATGEEPVFLEASVITGVEGLTIKTNARARNVALCSPVTLGIGRIARIWAA